MKIHNPIVLTSFVLCLCLAIPSGCSKEKTPAEQAPSSEQSSPALTPPANDQASEQPAAESAPSQTATATEVETQQPPTPPLFEDFEGKPQISLFPRVGDFRPEDGEVERLPFWLTFLDHLARVSGVVTSGEDDNHAWSFRSIETVDSIAWFAPLAVAPNTKYQVSFRIRADLPEKAAAGLGVLEFDKFRWLGEQYPESLFKEAHKKTHEGIRLSGKIAWQTQQFSFTTGPDSGMIHLVLFREGAPSREPVQFDDLRIEAIP